MFPAMFQREWFELSRLVKVVRTTVYFSWRQSAPSYDKEIWPITQTRRGSVWFRVLVRWAHRPRAFAVQLKHIAMGWCRRRWRWWARSRVKHWSDNQSNLVRYVTVRTVFQSTTHQDRDSQENATHDDWRHNDTHHFSAEVWMIEWTHSWDSRVLCKFKKAI